MNLLTTNRLVFLHSRSELRVQDVEFVGFTAASTGRPDYWTHIVLNFIGPNDGQGIRIYHNGTEVASETEKYAYSSPTSAGNGKIVSGRRYTDHNPRYLTMQVDELLYFNSALTPDQIQSLYNGV